MSGQSITEVHNEEQTVTEEISTIFTIVLSFCLLHTQNAMGSFEAEFWILKPRDGDYDEEEDKVLIEARRRLL